MKIIKTIALSLAAVILAGCANNSVATAENGARIINRSQNISNHGELHLDTEERLKFMDYESMNDVFICSSPNCTHTDPESCSAFGMGNRQVLYNNYIYYITSEIVNNGDKLKSLMHICRAKTDGTERKTLITEEDFYEGVDSSVNALVSGDELYFCASENEFDQYGDTGFKKIYFFRFNMREEKLENIAKICEGYHAGVWIYGLWNKKIYFNYSAFDHELTEEEHKALDKSKIYTYKTYDTENGSFEEWEQPKSAVYAGKGYLVYEKDSGLSVIDENGRETYFENFPYSSTFEIFDGKVFSPYGKKWGEIATGKTYPLNATESWDSIRDYVDGNYILKTYSSNEDGRITGYEFKKVSREELLGQ